MDLKKVTSKFNFYQQVRILLLKLRTDKMSAIETLDKKIHFTSTLSLNSPNGQVERIESDFTGEPVIVTVSVNGLTGAMGALPTVYSEWLIERHTNYSDTCAKAFFDIFGHRLYCLDYLAWQKNHLYARAELESEQPLHKENLALTGLLNSFSYFGAEYYAHIFSLSVKSMVNLEVWLGHYYSVPVHVTPFTGGWSSVHLSETCNLGMKQQPLKIAPMIGHFRWDFQSYFTVTLGPMKESLSQAYLPEGEFYHDLWERINYYVGPGLNFKVFLNLIDGNSSPLGEGQLGRHLCIGDQLKSRLLQVYHPSNFS